MGRIMLATSESTAEEYGGTFENEWQSLGTYNLADGNGTMQLSDTIADAKDLLFVIGSGTQIRPVQSSVIPYSLFSSKGFVMQFDNVGTLNYCLFSKATDTTLTVANVTTGSTMYMTVYKKL